MKKIVLTRKIKLKVHVPDIITDEKEKHEYINFAWDYLRKLNQQNFELHNIVMKKIIQFESILQTVLNQDEGSKNFNGYIYTYLANYLKTIPETEKYVTSLIYAPISKNVLDKYNNDFIDIQLGNKNLTYYKKDQPIPLNLTNVSSKYVKTINDVKVRETTKPS